MPTDFDVEAILAKLTLQNKIKLLSGSGWWHTEAIPEAGIQSLRMSDGPNGVRGSRFFNGVPASCFPASTGLGSSFDIDLAKKIGEALGDESRAKGCHVLLAPTVNIQRSPLGGRSFESFSEDPHLSGTIAASYINGLQSKGISATIKHFVANDQEFQRFSISSEVSERALREIYLKPFQIAIKASNPWAIMSAYNRVNGLHASEHKTLLDDVLRKEWGYKGAVISDWTGTYSTVESIKAGLDIEMPGPTVMRGKAIDRAIAAEKLFESDLNPRVRKVLELLKHAYESGVPFDAPEGTIDTPELRQLLRTAAADSIVLLKNDKNLLPLSADKSKKIAVIGPNAKVAMTSGGGSARLLSTYTVTPLEGITKAAAELGANVEYTIGAISHQHLPLLDLHLLQGATLEFWNENPSADYLSPQPDFTVPLPPVVWSTNTATSQCVLLDGIDEQKVNTKNWLKYSAQFTPDEDGDWEVDLTVAGRGNLFIDKQLVVDLTTNPPPKGEAFLGFGTSPVRATLKNVKAGQTYNIEIRVDNAEFAAQTLPFPCWGGIRMGGMKHIDEKAALQKAVQLAKDSDVTILVVGLNHDWETEGNDRQNIELPGLTNDLVREVLQANPNTVVVNQSGAPVSMPWADDASTLLQAFYGGNELGNGLADVIFGKVNPSGKLSMTFPKRLEDSPSYPSFGDKVQVHGKVFYNEGVFVGYRGFEINKTAPLFAFGFGLSYTQFEYSNLKITNISPDGRSTVSFDIKNVGSVRGREVAQIYVKDNEASLPRPVKELKGFVKVDLAPGETKSITHVLDREAWGFYDEREAHWIAESGTFKISVAASSTDIHLSGDATLKETFTWVGL